MLKNSLKKLRESNGLTQKEVAEKLNGSLYNEIAHLKNQIVKIHPPSGWLLFFGHSPIFSSYT